MARDTSKTKPDPETKPEIKAESEPEPKAPEAEELQESREEVAEHHEELATSQVSSEMETIKVTGDEARDTIAQTMQAANNLAEPEIAEEAEDGNKALLKTDLLKEVDALKEFIEAGRYRNAADTAEDITNRLKNLCL